MNWDLGRTRINAAHEPLFLDSPAPRPPRLSIRKRKSLKNAITLVSGLVCYNRSTALWALNSAVECHLHTVEVIGSNPIAPTSPSHFLGADVLGGPQDFAW